MKYEDTIGRLRNDEDSAGWKWHYWFVVRGYNVLDLFVLSGVFVIARPENKMITLCLLTAEAIYFVACGVLFSGEFQPLYLFFVYTAG